MLKLVTFLVAAIVVLGDFAHAAPPPVKIGNGSILIGRSNSVPNTHALQCMPEGASVILRNAASEEQFLYQAGLDSSRWSGSLRKRKLSPESASDIGSVDGMSHAEWDAADILTGSVDAAAQPAPEDRKIFTLSIDQSKNQALSFSTAEFRWEQLGTEQRKFLDAAPTTRKADGMGEKRLQYLRGVRTNEMGWMGRSGGIFRARNKILGDIANSNIVYVGAPALRVQGSAYQEFAVSRKNRTHALYVGANDGMLHAFSAVDGRELFAYVPNVLMPVLNQLTRSDYVHRPYVDGGIAVAEAVVGGAWKTILAAGFGGGAQGVFALDVSDPSNFGKGTDTGTGAASGALWEFSDSDDADMGNLLHPPSIAKFKMRTVGGTIETKYFVVVPSGLNNYQNDGAKKYNAAAPGALFLLALDKNPAEPWKKNSNYYKFTMPVRDATMQNGLSAPGLVLGDNGVVLYAYAGDLQGNLWRFDFTGDAPWTNAKPGSTPLFMAKDARDVHQPISAQPKVVYAPGGGYLVLFGTGKYMEDADASSENFRTQSYYAIYDSTARKYAVTGREQLAERTLTRVGEAMEVSGREFSYGEAAPAKRGWYLDFPDAQITGERMVGNAVTAFGKLFFNSFIPGSDACGKNQGRSYALNALNGLSIDGKRTGSAFTGDQFMSPTLMETGSKTITIKATGKAIVKRKYGAANFGNDSAKINVRTPGESDKTVSVTEYSRRLSWREIPNWQELRDASGKN